MMDRALAATTGRGELGHWVLAYPLPDWSLRGRDAIIQNTRQFSDHPFRLDGDAVIAGFTELRRIAVRRVMLASLNTS